MVVFAFFVLSGCGLVSKRQANVAEKTFSGAPTENIKEGSVADYDPNTDYFPEKATIRHSKQLEVEYHKNYKLVTVNIRGNSQNQHRYLLVQRGTPRPEGFEGVRTIEVPVRNFALMNWQHAYAVEILNLHDRLLGVDSFDSYSAPGIVKMIKEGKLVNTLYGFHKSNPEALIGLNADVVIMYFWDDPAEDSNPKLDEAGVKTVYAADSLETSPLAQAEWLKLDALFFNREKDMETYFDGISEKYETLVAKTRNATNKPTVLNNGIFKGAWNLPGGKSYVAAYLKDAGADYIWADDPSTGFNPTAVEKVLDRASEAEYWIDPIYTEKFRSVDDLAAANPRYGLFRAVKEGKVFINDLQRNEKGTNPYFQQGFADPYLILADLTKIFHPELVPEHQFVFYRQLAPSSK